MKWRVEYRPSSLRLPSARSFHLQTSGRPSARRSGRTRQEQATGQVPRPLHPPGQQKRPEPRHSAGERLPPPSQTTTASRPWSESRAVQAAPRRATASSFSTAQARTWPDHAAPERLPRPCPRQTPARVNDGPCGWAGRTPVRNRLKQHLHGHDGQPMGWHGERLSSTSRQLLRLWYIPDFFHAPCPHGHTNISQNGIAG